MHVETARRNGARSRNTRLAAIRSFFRYVAMNEPAYLLHCQRILTMPGKRYVKRTLTFLDRQEAMPAARRSIKWSFPKLRELTIGKPPSLGRNSLSSVRW